LVPLQYLKVTYTIKLYSTRFYKHYDKQMQ